MTRPMMMTILPGVFLLFALTWGGGVEGKLSATLTVIPEDLIRADPTCTQYCKDQWTLMSGLSATPTALATYACCRMGNKDEYCECKNTGTSNVNGASCFPTLVTPQECCSKAQPGTTLPCNNANGAHANKFCCRNVKRHGPEFEHCDGKFKEGTTLPICRPEFCRSLNGDPANDGQPCGTTGLICCEGDCVPGVEGGCCACIKADGSDKDDGVTCGTGRVCCFGKCVSGTTCPQCSTDANCATQGGGRCCSGVCKPPGVGCQCTSTSQCNPSNEICCSGFCTSKAKGCCRLADGTPVADNDFCVIPRPFDASGLCCDGVCQPECIERCPLCTDNCECSGLTPICEDGQCSPNPPGCCDPDCNSNEVCCAGKCVLKTEGCCIENGIAVPDNEPCGTAGGPRRCCHGECKDVSGSDGICPKCFSDCHCDEGQFCCVARGFCQTRGFDCECSPIDAPCEAVGCSHCCRGRCLSDSQCPECFTNSDCPADQSVCCKITGTCQAESDPPCHCNGPDDCRALTQQCCHGDCVPSNIDCPECFVNDDCDPSLRCCNERCVPCTQCVAQTCQA